MRLELRPFQTIFTSDGNGTIVFMFELNLYVRELILYISTNKSRVPTRCLPNLFFCSYRLIRYYYRLYVHDFFPLLLPQLHDHSV